MFYKLLGNNQIGAITPSMGYLPLICCCCLVMLFSVLLQNKTLLEALIHDLQSGLKAKSAL